MPRAPVVHSLPVVCIFALSDGSVAAPSHSAFVAG